MYRRRPVTSSTRYGVWWTHTTWVPMEVKAQAQAVGGTRGGGLSCGTRRSLVPTPTPTCPPCTGGPCVADIKHALHNRGVCVVWCVVLVLQGGKWQAALHPCNAGGAEKSRRVGVLVWSRNVYTGLCFCTGSSARATPLVCCHTILAPTCSGLSVRCSRRG